MRELFWTIFELIINLFESILFTYFIFGILKHKHKHVNKILPFTACTVTLFCLTTIFNYFTYFENIAVFSYLLITFFYCLLFFDCPLFKKVLLSLIPSNAIAISSIVSTNLISAIFNKNIIELMSESDIYRFLTILIANALLFVILFLTQNMINKNGFELENSELSLIGTVFIISIFSFMFLYFSIFNNKSRTSNLFISIAIIGLVVINLSTYLLISKLNQKHIIEMQNKLLKQQNKAQFESIEEIKRQFEETQKIRHDFKNTLQVLKVLLDDKSYEKIGNLIVENLNQIQDTPKLIATNSEYVNAIVNLKLAKAYKQKIKVIINIISDIDNQASMDLCNLIGNMFDNAIEASQNSEKRFIYFEISQKNENLNIFLKNSIDQSVLTSNPHLQSTKKSNNHGFGTSIIKEIAMRHHGIADFYEEDNCFCCNVIARF